MAQKFLLMVLLLGLVSCKSETETSSSVTMSIESNQTLGSYHHSIDYYIPSDATSAIVFLHGGGGKKEGYAYNLGLKSTSNTTSYELTSSGESWLESNKVIAVFPQGQTVSGYNWTWNNYVMDSGEDDVAFLQDLVSHIKSTYSVSKVYIIGHSNGGMMANRMWCESPDTFDGYGTIVGPPSTHLHSAGSNPCSPSTVKPYIGIVGDSDTVLQTSGNMSSATWTINSILVTDASAWVDTTPRVLNDKLYHSTRVTMKCSGSVATPTTSGQITTYSDCSDTLRLVVVAQTTINGDPSGGDHCLLTVNATCDTTLAGDTGLDPKTTIFNFLKNF